MKTKERLQTTLDRLPYGPEGVPENQKVSKRLPEGVRSRELYEDIVRIAGPSFVELLLTQLTSMVDLMMVGSMGCLLYTSRSFSMVTRLSSRLASRSSKASSPSSRRDFASWIMKSGSPSFWEMAKALLFPGMPMSRR